ncbi:alpha/beta hydrolase [Luteibacter yeojuensis]
MATCLLMSWGAASAEPALWQPAGGRAQVALWPGTPPHPNTVPGPEYVKTGTDLIGGKPVTWISNVSRPTITIYAPTGANTGAAVIVIPGGGFEGLAMDLEGTDVCDWLTPKGVTCVLLKYRVPSPPYEWRCDCRPHNLALSMPSLADTQRALRLVRSKAATWHIDPHKVGVLGFSAGGFLVAEASTNFKRRIYAPVDAVDKQSARPDFALAIYPGHLTTDYRTLNPNIPVSAETPPTFVLQAEDDEVDGVNQALVYFTALKKAGVPAEMHLYAHGGHAFGLRPTAEPITHWTGLADAWMRGIGMTARTP